MENALEYVQIPVLHWGMSAERILFAGLILIAALAKQDIFATSVENAPLQVLQFGADFIRYILLIATEL